VSSSFEPSSIGSHRSDSPTCSAARESRAIRRASGRTIDQKPRLVARKLTRPAVARRPQRIVGRPNLGCHVVCTIAHGPDCAPTNTTRPPRGGPYARTAIGDAGGAGMDAKIVSSSGGAAGFCERRVVASYA
jgi:hypothetical protein